MLRSLKLCILLKVLMTLALMTFAWRSSVRQSVHGSIEEDPEYPKNFLEGAVVFEPIEADEYVSSKIESVQKYSDSVIVGNEIVLQESTTPSPKGTPSEPTFLRAFVEFGNRLNKTDIFVTFRWNKPEFTNGVIQKYRVQYWFIENLRRIRTSVDIIPDKILQHKVYDLKLHTVYYFKVQAYNEVGAGPYTKFINVSTTNENPIPISLIVGVDATIVQVLDVDLQIGFEYHNFYDDDNYNTIYKEIIYSALEHKIYGITKTLELITWDFNSSAIKTNPNYTKIANLDSSAHNLCIDWIARNLYWIEVSNQTNNLMKLDLTLWQMGIVKYDNILKINEFKCLNVLPSKGYFYWIGLISDKQYMIMQSDFEGKNVKPFFKNEDKCFCPYKLLESESVMQIDNTNIDKPLIYWTLKDRLIVADISGCRCNQILSAGNQTNFVYLTIDNANIYLHCRNEGQIYILKKKYALESKGNAFGHVQKTNILLTRYQNIKSLDKSLQPYSLTRCLTPNVKDYHVDKVNITANSITVRLPEPILNDGCERYNLATTIYNISVNYLTCLDNDLNKSEEFNVQTYERHYEFQNLTPFTEYTFKLALSNFYVDKFSMDFLFGADVKLTTIPGKLNAPEDVTVQVLTPTLAVVYWMPPKKLNCVAVTYNVYSFKILSINSMEMEIEYNPSFSASFNKPERTLDGKFFTIIPGLLSEQTYVIFVRVYPTNYSQREYVTDSNKTVYMEQNNINLSGVTTDSMNISLISSVNLINIRYSYALEYKHYMMSEWQIADSTEVNNDKITFYIKNLLPRTLYKFRLFLKYSNLTTHLIDFIRSDVEEEFTFETLGNVPSAPGKPMVTRLLNFTYHLNWKHAQAHDSQVTLYRLEGLIVTNKYKEGNQTDKNEHWNLYYNGTDNYWIWIVTRDMNQKYRFRVQAKNAYGFGVWSESSAVVDLTESIEISAMQNYLPVILSLIVTLVILNVYYFYCSYRQHKEGNEILLLSMMTNIDQLATVNEMLPGNVQPNALYAPTLQCNKNEFGLTIIEKKQIIPGKFLGSGAFGEVIQGTVKDFEGSDITTVAIKMLRKDASSQEKKKFLQEAKLMSQLRHKHVLRLLGICLDMDSPWLILELMEAGDLLKYLRESRTLQPSDSHALRLQDLLAMCEDVARGCCYLEKQHFVHRDLACRNCLISARNRENRIVKIGDFGLARDIYENDYYRMKGGTKLPIRWMAPESLMYGIFTSQSDVWAFGVVMWEITSLGLQPYCAKTNSEVLQYVCAGGKLSKPLNCPPTLYQLMQQCWSAVDDRPNVILCLENILTLRDNIEDTILNSVDIIRPAELPLSGQIEDVGSTASRTFEPLTANDASNDVIEPLT